MFRPLSLPPALRQVATRAVRSAYPTSQHIGSVQPSKPSSFIGSTSPRRVKHSPVLPLEALALSSDVKREIHNYISSQNASSRQLRQNASGPNLMRAPESLNAKIPISGGQPVVQPPPDYDANQTAAYAALRMPGTYAANVFVLAEVKRILPDFSPISLLDFGSGTNTSLIASSRLFVGENAGETLDSSPAHPTEESCSIREACLVEKSADMRALSARLSQAEFSDVDDVKTEYVSSLRECEPKSEGHDLVISSYSLNEVVRNAMCNPAKHEESDPSDMSVSRGDRQKGAEKKLRRTLKALWSKTATNGVFVIIEDGTAAGFEVIAFAREMLLNLSPPLSNSLFKSDAESEQGADNDTAQKSDESVSYRARVIAPCLHSNSCPLNGSITRRRICRFQQRLNRPLFARTALRLPNGYEDEYFSFLVVQKLAAGDESTEHLGESRWGRLIRQPLLKGKHVALDACTREGTLERRVISKKNAAGGDYSLARRAKWGDIWTARPSSKPQPLNF